MTTIPNSMRAAVIRQPGGPDVLKVEEIPVPAPKQGEVLIKIMAAGMNRSEMFTRQGGFEDFSSEGRMGCSKRVR
jgi:NADPH:quinone reductase-like Zn-dependent oxidoreductase